MPSPTSDPRWCRATTWSTVSSKPTRSGCSSAFRSPGRRANSKCSGRCQRRRASDTGASSGITTARLVIGKESAAPRRSSRNYMAQYKRAADGTQRLRLHHGDSHPGRHRHGQGHRRVKVCKRIENQNFDVLSDQAGFLPRRRPSADLADVVRQIRADGTPKTSTTSSTWSTSSRATRSRRAADGNARHLQAGWP